MVSGRAAIILAAGTSQRMGTPKALLPWNGTTLLDHAVQQARSAGAESIVVVLGPATRHLTPQALVVVNPSPDTGRSASIRIGAAALPEDVQQIIVQSVDQPVPSKVLEKLFATEGDVVVPTCEGRRGHPVCFAGHLLEDLRNVKEEDLGLRAVVRRHDVTEVPVDDAAILRNLNDPAAYAEARAGL